MQSGSLGKWFLAALPALGLSMLSADRARALEARIDASHDAQLYALESPFGEPALFRRRQTSTLGLELDEIAGPRLRPRDPALGFRSRLRLDADFGQSGAERDPESTRYVPGLRQAPLDLMYAYLEGRGYLGGVLGFRLGRQYVVDALGFWSFDGGALRLTFVPEIELGLYAGFEQRSGLPMLGTPRWSGDGVARGDRSGLEDSRHIGYLDESELAPAAGASLAFFPVEAVSARLDYRKVMNRSTVRLSQFADENAEPRSFGGLRASREEVGGSLGAALAEIGAARGSGVYDLYVQEVRSYAVALDAFPSKTVSAGARLDYELPTFDADSIFNWFTHRGSTRAVGELRISPTRAFDLGLSGGVQSYETEGDPDAPLAATGAVDRDTTARRIDPLGNVEAVYRWSENRASLSGMLQGGDGAHRFGGDLRWSRRYGGYYDSLVVLSLYDWADALRPTRDATSFTYVLGGGVRPSERWARRGRLGAEWEHSVNRLVGQRFRLLVTLDFTVLE